MIVEPGTTHNKPFEDGDGAFFIGLRVRNCCKELWALTPVRFTTRVRTDTRTECRSDAPGNSVREMGERMNGGAVKDDRSPDQDAILCTIWMSS